MLSFDSCHLATALCHIFVKDFHEQGLSQVSVLLNLSCTLLKNSQMYFKNFAMSTPLPFCSVIHERVWSIPATHMWGKRLSKMFILSINWESLGKYLLNFLFYKTLCVTFCKGNPISLLNQLPSAMSLHARLALYPFLCFYDFLNADATNFIWENRVKSLEVVQRRV